jgi:hypothetical protein
MYLVSVVEVKSKIFKIIWRGYVIQNARMLLKEIKVFPSKSHVPPMLLKEEIKSKYSKS